jgi:hypothetical protein
MVGIRPSHTAYCKSTAAASTATAQLAFASRMAEMMSDDADLQVAHGLDPLLILLRITTL